MKQRLERMLSPAAWIALYFLMPLSETSFAAQTHIPVSYRNSIYGIVDDMTFQVHYGSSDTVLFDRWRLFSHMAGSSITIRGNAEDPQYDAFVSRLTNGVDEHLFFGYTIQGAGTEYHVEQESAYFSPVDLAGKRVGPITLTIKSLTFNLSIYWIGMMPLFITDVEFTGELTVNWQAPLNPSILGLLLFETGR